jgi:hypothetical protein
VKLTAHLQLVPRSRKRGSIHPFSPASLWRSAHLRTGTNLLLPINNFVDRRRVSGRDPCDLNNTQRRDG